MESDSALKIALFLVIFNLSLPIIGMLGIWNTVPSGLGVTDLLFGNWDFGSLAVTAVGGVAIVGAIVFQMSVGAAVFAAVFAGSAKMFTATLNIMVTAFSVGEAAPLLAAVQGIVVIGINAIFLFVFMELSR